jgi:hypothetical protein
MIPKSGCRFSDKIVLHVKLERDADSKNQHPALGRFAKRPSICHHGRQAEGPPG